MQNKLFLVCPFSCLEGFIREKYGEHIFFITALGTVLHPEVEEQVVSIRHLIKKERIKQIYIVKDLSCCFIQRVISRQMHIKTSHQCLVENLFIDNYRQISEALTEAEQKTKLAELIIRHQALKLLEPNFLGNQIIQNNIQLIGIITEKSKNKYAEKTINLPTLNQ